jgi:hypothetical protein
MSWISRKTILNEKDGTEKKVICSLQITSGHRERQVKDRKDRQTYSQKRDK